MSVVFALAFPTAGGAADHQRAEAPRQATVALGLHDEEVATPRSFPLSPSGAMPPTRLNCIALMTRTKRELSTLRKSYAGRPLLVAGCGSSPSSWKYDRGPMSGFKPDADWAGEYRVLSERQTSAATPTARTYRRYLRKVKSVLGSQVEKWEVWNEADLPLFYRGKPRDLINLTFAAARVFGRERVTSPSWCPCAITSPDGLTGAWVRGRYLTRSEFIDAYWTGLVAEARRRGVPLPVTTLNIHSYGVGTTPRAAARDRLLKIRGFKRQAQSLLGRRLYRSLNLWDSEWNLRRYVSNPSDPQQGFRDSPRNARIWRKSVRKAACLGVERQYVYRWLDEPAQPTSFESAQLQLNPNTVWLNDAFKRSSGQSVTCR